MKKIGILGGGQLGMLLAQSLVKLGAEAWVYDPDKDAPACRTVRHSVNADWYDEAALSSFISNCDRVTYEFENVPYDCLAKLKQPINVFPSLDVLKITQNRIHEKEFLRTQGLPHVPYIIANNVAQLKERIDNLKFPVIIKSATGGYDGKGQTFLHSKNELEEKFTANSKQPLPFPVIVEQAIDLYMEVSCIIGRGLSGSEIAFPVFENTHHNHILDTTLMPARLPEKASAAVRKLAGEAANKLKVSGLLCTEFFIARKKEPVSSAHSIDEFDLYINEFAPRPHNSGHVTMSGCTYSQFDVLARILVDLPLSAPDLIGPGYFCMANMLGDIWLKQGTKDGDKLNLNNLDNYKDLIAIIIYGKKEARRGRKMGHLITSGKTPESAIAASNSLRQQLQELKAVE